ncbi:molybdopterin cofactor-binding domain-containing protein [Kordiimonas sp.]|uniref:xanthine dehydrogenase family protein molybdopterin-binding subunit n=1 Tax=Kordiimonas sp. TaxID=1970157 RepID=UPI003A930DB5
MAELLLDRRTTLKLIMATGGLTLAYPRAALAAGTDTPNYQRDGMDVPLVRINADNSAVIYCPNPDMGQGTSTGIPLMIVEELDLDWARVTIETMELIRHRAADGTMHFTHSRQASGGSGSIRRGWGNLPKMGAQGRDMFVRAASSLWKVRAEDLQTRDSHVIDPASGRRAPYAALLETVAALRPRENVRLKDKSEYRLIGRPQLAKAARDIVTGKPIFGLDQEMAGMVHAVIARCPHFSGSVKSFDATEALKVPGVREIVEIKQSDPDGPLAWLLVASIAVIADNFWAAKKARDLLDITWDSGPFAGYSSAKVEAASIATLDRGEGFELLNHEGRERREGDFYGAYDTAAHKYEAKYIVPRVAHALMEPHSAIADVREDKIFINYPCQFPARGQDLAHQMTGIPHENIHVKVSRSGGAFGRRWELDYPAEAIHLSQVLKKPVKVTWTREDELTQCRYRAANHYHMSAGLDGDGNLIALRQRQASDYPSLHKDRDVNVEWAYEDLMGWHFEAGIVKNHLMEQRFTPGPVPRGPWRAPGSVNTAFAQMSFLDELAHEAGRDPLEFQLQVLGKPRFLPEGIEGPFEMHTGRMAACLKFAAEKAGWGAPLPKGWGRGIAGYHSHLSYVAHVIEVSVTEGELTVERVVSAADCGLVINPLGVAAQIEGSIHDGLSVALAQEITIENAAVQQDNFDSYVMARMDRAPKKIEIHLMESDGHPTGMGEPAIPPFAPALMNAIYNATGKRIRRLPIGDQLSA